MKTPGDAAIEKAMSLGNSLASNQHTFYAKRAPRIEAKNSTTKRKFNMCT
jgi:hypothetical protein